MIVFQNTDINWGLLAGALLLMLVGLYLFLSGISSSLIPLSEATGRDLVPVCYKIPVILFVGLIGYFATLLEPGLRILANQIETVSVGAIHSSKITHMAAVGFAIGAGLGIGRILSPFSMKLSAGIALLLLFLLVLLAPKSIVGIAFDCPLIHFPLGGQSRHRGKFTGANPPVNVHVPLKRGVGEFHSQLKLHTKS